MDFFGAPTSQYGDNSAFIILDGLDEAPRKEREALFKLLKDLDGFSTGAVTSPRLRVLVIGRPDLRDDTIFIWDKPIIYSKGLSRLLSPTADVFGEFGRLAPRFSARITAETKTQIDDCRTIVIL